MTEISKPPQHEYSNPQRELNDRWLQQEVDTIWNSGGGTLVVPAGTYQMQNALHLRDNVQLVGEAGTVLQKAPTVSSPLNYGIGYGHYEFAVAEPEKFAVGMGVLIKDDNARGFYTTLATIVDRSAEYFYIDQPFSHDYHPTKNGSVTSVHSLIYGREVRNSSVRNITLDGNWPQEEIYYLNGCRGGGAFLLQAHNVTLEDVEVRNFHGDAVSFQQCTDITILNCFIHHNFGGGLHPGSGSVRYSLLNNRIEDNGGCGIFYCLRTTHSLCAENEVSRNGEDGISVGERDTDHILRKNNISGNQGAGILLRPPMVQSGDRVWIEGNTMEGNNISGQSAEFYIAHNLRDVAFVGNKIQPQNGPAIFVEPNCANLILTENEIGGRLQSPSDINGDTGAVSVVRPKQFPAIGPDAAGSDSARHLGVEYLSAAK